MKPGGKEVKRRIPTAVRVFCLILGLWAGSCCGYCTPVALAEPPASGPNQIILTWTGDPAAAQSVTWLMSENITAQLQYWKEEEFSENFDSPSVIEVQGTPFDSIHYRYQANLSGLIPDTAYVYRVGAEGAWSEPRSFTTAGDTEKFSFLYLGDVQAGYAEWGNMLNSIHGSYPQIKFALLGGDLTDNGSDETEWGQFLDAATGVFSRIPVMPALGNHDGSMYFKFFALPDNGPDGLEREFYSFDYGNAHFVVLNSNNNTNQAAKEWLQQDLQSTAGKWKFAVFHHPAYPAYDDYKTIDESICENWVPILEQNGVDMVFVGHQHEYMRTYPIFQGEVQSDPGCYGIVYVMGNAGSKVYGAGSGFPYIACEETGSNYQIIDIDGETMTLTSVKSTGEKIEQYTLPAGTDPSYTLTIQPDAAYSCGAAQDGIPMMTVNAGNTGFRYFTVHVASEIMHNGSEAIVFTHLRNGTQLGLSVSKADFDLAATAQAGFNVKPGDVIRAYLVDDLTNDADLNPEILQ